MGKDLDKRISLALSGGGARGYVHLGMMEALLSHGYQIKAIAGTSMGALIGCLAAQSMPPVDIFQLLTKTKVSEFLSPKLSLSGLISMEKFILHYEKLLSIKDLSVSEIPIYVATTNLTVGESIVFSIGPVGSIVAASCCVPGLFQPVEMNQQFFVDGGLTLNLPAEPLLHHPWPIFGFHSNAYPNPASLKSMKEVLEKSSQLAIYQNTKQSMTLCKSVFEPPEMAAFSSFAFNKAEQFFDIGARFMNAALSEVAI